MRISEPLPRLTPDLRVETERERRVASSECRSHGREEHPARSYYPSSDDSIFRGTRDYVLPPVLCCRMRKPYRYTWEISLVPFIFVETNPSDIPIFGNTGWWIMFRFLGRPLYYCWIRGIALPFAPPGLSTVTWNMRICYKLWVVSPAPE